MKRFWNLLTEIFRGLLDGKKVPQDVQVLLGRRGVDSTELLAVLADDRDGVRQFAKDTLGLDPAADPALNVTVAKLVVGWEAAKQRLQVKSQQGAHATAEREAKMICLGCASGLSNSITL